jgi:hypothetical protein
MKHGSKIEVSVAYIHGRIEAQLEAFAQSLDIPAWELAGRVGALLLGAESWSVLGTEDRVPSVSGSATERSKTARKVAVDGGTHRSSAQKAYWERMTPKQRRQEVRRRQRVRRVNDSKKHPAT